MAQAVALYKGGESWWLDPKSDDVRKLSERHKHSEETDPWDDPLLRYVTGLGAGVFFTTGDALEHGVGIKETKDHDRQKAIRVGKILRRLGYIYAKQGPQRKKCWKTPERRNGKENHS